MSTTVERSLVTADVSPRNTLLRVARNERQFLLLLGIAFFLAGAFAGVPSVARWIGFALAAYSTVANDSIQTVGTFIVSNGQRRWWVLWLFIGGVFLATATAGWLSGAGDVSFGRLASKGFAEAPQTFTVLQVAAPVFLLLLTRMRMPVSTTFLILSCFATDPEGIAEVLEKSLWGYGIAFVFAAVSFGLTAKLVARYASGPASRWWGPAQWISTGVLWVSWIQQDMANLAVYLPRQLGLWEFVAFAGTVFAGLGVLFYLRGDRIQRIVSEKSSVVDIRAATLIDFVYAIILFGFKEVSTIPMSTTWVFIGLLAGRELTLIILGTADRSLQERASPRGTRRALRHHRARRLRRARPRGQPDLPRGRLGLVASGAPAPEASGEDPGMPLASDARGGRYSTWPGWKRAAPAAGRQRLSGSNVLQNSRERSRSRTKPSLPGPQLWSSCPSVMTAKTYGPDGAWT